MNSVSFFCFCTHPSSSISLLDRGIRKRSSTRAVYSDSASLSHAVLSINLYQLDQGSSKPLCTMRLVDTGGFVRSGRADQGYPAEVTAVNRDITALGRVINALRLVSSKSSPTSSASSIVGGSSVYTSTNGGGFKHVPYRDSKLTRLLHDGLDSNGLTVSSLKFSPYITNCNNAS